MTLAEQVMICLYLSLISLVATAPIIGPLSVRQLNLSAGKGCSHHGPRSEVCMPGGAESHQNRPVTAPSIKSARLSAVQSDKHPL